MPAFSVSKSINIAAPRKAVHQKILNLRSWPEWSPWLISEKSASVSFSADDKTYSWNGDIVGAGQLTITSETADKIECALEFLKPWKSKADVHFDLKEIDPTNTQVTWSMDSALPFFMFPMKNMMIAAIGSDYDRGLNMLKSLLETGDIPSSLDFGQTEVQAMDILGVTASCSVKEVGPSMEKSFCKFGEAIATSGINPTSPPLAIYHKWDLVKGTCDYTIGAPFPAGTEAPSLVSATIPACRCYTVKHTGPYSFLSNAWASGFGHMRAKQFKLNKKIDAFEIYQNDPKEVEANELITIVHFPMK